MWSGTEKDKPRTRGLMLEHILDAAEFEEVTKSFLKQKIGIRSPQTFLTFPEEKLEGKVDDNIFTHGDLFMIMKIRAWFKMWYSQHEDDPENGDWLDEMSPEALEISTYNKSYCKTGTQAKGQTKEHKR